MTSGDLSTRVGWPAEDPPDARPRQGPEDRGEALLAARRMDLDREQEQDEARGERGRETDQWAPL